TCGTRPNPHQGEIARWRPGLKFARGGQTIARQILHIGLPVIVLLVALIPDQRMVVSAQDARSASTPVPVTFTPERARALVSPTRMPLGSNLGGLLDFSSEIVFLDPFKQSRDWISGTQSTFDDSRTLDLDARGWVKSLQPGQIARTLMFSDPA